MLGNETIERSILKRLSGCSSFGLNPNGRDCRGCIHYDIYQENREKRINEVLARMAKAEEIRVARKKAEREFSEAMDSLRERDKIQLLPMEELVLLEVAQSFEA